MERGKITKVMEKGYGFIYVEWGGTELFFNAKALRGLVFSKALIGTEVDFESERQPDGRHRATIVQPAA